MEIVPVNNSKSVAAFIEVPFRIYKGDQNWVPQLRSDSKKLMDPKANPFFRHSQIEHFVAMSGGEPVGRISASVYPAHNTKYKTRTGFFGFFESTDDRKVAAALLGAAEAWVKQRGMDRIAGPYNYCSTQEMGLITEGFEQAPALFQTYNARYYPELLRDAGYTPVFEMNTFAWDASDKHRIQAVLDWGDAVKAKEKLMIRPLDERHILEDLETYRRVFNDSFAENDEVLPITKDVFDFQIGMLKPFIDPRIMFAIEHQGTRAAFALVVPDLNELLARFGGKLGLGDIYQVLFRRTKLVRSCRAAVVLLIGALPKYNGMGIGRVLAAEIVRATRDAGYQALHTTWVHDGNWTSRAMMARWKSTPNKRFAVMGRAL